MNFIYDVFYRLFELGFSAELREELATDIKFVCIILTVLFIYGVVVRPLFSLIFPKKR